MVQSLYISPKYLRIFEERHLFYMLANFFGEQSDLSVRIFDSKCRAVVSTKSLAFIMFHVY
jgi:hypothetical protein